jgi:hypothetical protein
MLYFSLARARSPPLIFCLYLPVLFDELLAAEMLTSDADEADPLCVKVVLYRGKPEGFLAA